MKNTEKNKIVLTLVIVVWLLKVPAGQAYSESNLVPSGQ